MDLRVNLNHKKQHLHHHFFKDQVWCKIADLYIGVCYRSINYSIVGPDNNDNMYQLLHEVSKEHFLLMGDFNFPDVNLAQSCCE